MVLVEGVDLRVREVQVEEAVLRAFRVEGAVPQLEQVLSAVDKVGLLGVETWMKSVGIRVVEDRIVGAASLRVVGVPAQAEIVDLLFVGVIVEVVGFLFAAVVVEAEVVGLRLGSS